jgi:anti-sigma regulatory factor (Ser/Thr protein kinase)
LESGNEDDTETMTLPLSPSSAPVFVETFRATPEELRRMRAAVRTWLRRHAVPPEEETDLLLAIGEACANAVEHAYAGAAPGAVEIRIAHGERDDELLVEVRDFGRWRVAQGGTDPDRGRGTELMRALAEDLELETGSAGTTVILRLRLPSKTARGRS